MNVTETVGFVPNPSGRGTLGLLWQCLLTYFLCLWTAIHPDCRDRHDHTVMLRSNSKGRWALVIFLLPEMAVLSVASEYFLARFVRDCRNELVEDVPDELRIEERDVEYPLITSTGGHNPGDHDSRAEATTAPASAPVAACTPEREHFSSCPVSRNTVRHKTKWGIAHGYLLQMGAITFKVSDASRSPLYPTLQGFQTLGRCGLLPSAAFLDEKIKALRRSDPLAKTVACLQVIWLAIQVISRQVEHLPITPLELNTLAQVWITIVIYAFWWYKPQGIYDVIEVDLSYCPKCRQIVKERGLDDEIMFARTPMYEDTFPEKQKSATLVLCAAVPVICGIYIAIDAMGWNAYFPTLTELFAWRLMICAFASSLALTMVAQLWFHLEWQDFGVLPYVGTIGLLLVGLCRTGLTILAFMSIRKLPVEAYSTPSWSDMLPHIG